MGVDSFSVFLMYFFALLDLLSFLSLPCLLGEERGSDPRFSSKLSADRTVAAVSVDDREDCDPDGIGVDGIAAAFRAAFLLYFLMELIELRL